MQVVKNENEVKDDTQEPKSKKRKIEVDEVIGDEVKNDEVDAKKPINDSEVNASGDTKKTQDEGDKIQANDSQSECLLSNLQGNVDENEASKSLALFMTGDWRQQLCKCQKCCQMYRCQDVDFLTDLEDTVHHYEEQSKKEG